MGTLPRKLGLESRQTQLQFTVLLSLFFCSFFLLLNEAAGIWLCKSNSSLSELAAGAAQELAGHQLACGEHCSLTVAGS